MPIAWTVAGSDSGGGAGIQADLKTFNAFGVHGCSVTTAITAQNSCSVTHLHPIPPESIQAQLEALLDDLPPQVIKSGMLGSQACCQRLASFLQKHPTPFVCDPVLRSTSGTRLLPPETLHLFIEQLLPQATLLTPNLPEAAVLTDKRHSSIEATALHLIQLGARSVLIKGGHTDAPFCTDFWSDGKTAFWLKSPRLQTRHSHGTGCILASAIAAGIAQGVTPRQAIINAKTYLNQSLKHPAGIGRGDGPLRLIPFLNREEDRPEIIE
jgi:hydroxymethylpyrimidine kinase / phosphomethylpyrimidine kinase / thiamine-phosphate diphosphorylase